MAKKKETKVEVDIPQVEEMVHETPIVKTPKVEVEPKQKRKEPTNRS